MTINPSQITFSSYDKFEGPYFRGTIPYTLPESPDFWDKVLAAVAATEGKLDSINGYDKCIISVSMIQFCEANYFLTSKLLSHIAEKMGANAVTGPLSDALKMSNATFKKFDEGWRFQFLDERGKVKTSDDQRALFFHSASGLKGTWNGEQKHHACVWAAGLASIWSDRTAQELQVRYIKAYLPNFTTSMVKSDLFDDPSTGKWVDVARAVYTSFAANNPANAARMYARFTASTKFTKFSPEWTICLIKELTFGPNISIYPIRYQAIKPVVERLWNVTLPTVSLLKNPYGPGPVVEQEPIDVPQTVIITDIKNHIIDDDDANEKLIVPRSSIVEWVIRVITYLISFFRISK